MNCFAHPTIDDADPCKIILECHFSRVWEKNGSSYKNLMGHIQLI